MLIARVVLVGSLVVSAYGHASRLALQAREQNLVSDVLETASLVPALHKDALSTWWNSDWAAPLEVSCATRERWGCDGPPPLSETFWSVASLSGENAPAGASVVDWIDNAHVASIAWQPYQDDSIYRLGDSADSQETLQPKDAACGAIANTDLDDDGKMDLIVWRPDNGTWYGFMSSDAHTAAAPVVRTWASGAQHGTPVAGDIDGDGRMDLIAWQPDRGTWHALLSSTDYDPAVPFAKTWGSGARRDVPFVGDLDGDARGDLIVWRPSNATWHGLLSTTDYAPSAPFIKAFGSDDHDDVPYIGDLDGDRIADLLTWRPGLCKWYGLLSSSDYREATTFRRRLDSASLDATAIPADIDGDGRLDLVVWQGHSQTWYGLLSSRGYSTQSPTVGIWGTALVKDLS